MVTENLTAIGVGVKEAFPRIINTKNPPKISSRTRKSVPHDTEAHRLREESASIEKGELSP